MLKSATAVDAMQTDETTSLLDVIKFAQDLKRTFDSSMIHVAIDVVRFN